MKIPLFGALALLALAGCGGNGGSGTLAGSYVGTASYDATSAATLTNLAATGTVSIEGRVDTFALAVVRNTGAGADALTGTFPSSTGSVTATLLKADGSTTTVSGTGSVARRGSVLVFDLSYPNATASGGTARYVVSLRQL